jgi:hypothetical protein
MAQHLLLELVDDVILLLERADRVIAQRRDRIRQPRELAPQVRNLRVPPRRLRTQLPRFLLRRIRVSGDGFGIRGSGMLLGGWSGLGLRA